MDFWADVSGPCLDPDSTLPAHQGGHSLPPFQTHSRYFYAPWGEECCGRDFVDLYFLQHHPFPHCQECARNLLRAASHICWQCRTYFRRYGTGLMQQIIGITPQRHDILSVLLPERGPNQMRLPEEARSQQSRENSLQDLAPPLLQVLLPPQNMCEFRELMLTRLSPSGNLRRLINSPAIPLPYHSPQALLPLPSHPGAGFLSGLSLSPEELHNVVPEDSTSPPPT